MTTATVMSIVSVVLSSLLYLIAAVAVGMMGRGKGRVLAVAGLLLALLHNLSNVFIFPLLGHVAADSSFWVRYMTYNVLSAVWSFLTWGLIAAGIILMSRMVLRRPPVAHGYALVGGESRIRLPEGTQWPELHSTQESIGNRLGSLPDDPPRHPTRHPQDGSGATSARYPGQ